MKTLSDRLTAMIRADGPLSIATYMDFCLHDRRQGYYATRPGLGEDFITAPEISQIFGELIGLWAAHEWQQMGAPASLALVEIGPGRGTLMADALRATQSVPGFAAATDLHFIEASPVLRRHLEEKFEQQGPVFLDQLEDLPTHQPFILIANEWLDSLPALQYVQVGDDWYERVIGLDERGNLTFGLRAEPAPASLDFGSAEAMVEIQPGLKTLIETLSGKLSAVSGRALFIDYGSAADTPGDTLRSYKEGQQIHPLQAPGQSDLTVDVDFARLKRLSEAAGLKTSGPVSQSQYLLALGAEARLNQLAKRHPDNATDLYQGVRKLVDPADMGERFQVLCLTSEGLTNPAAF